MSLFELPTAKTGGHIDAIQIFPAGQCALLCAVQMSLRKRDT
jgi:hypothetical protein